MGILGGVERREDGGWRRGKMEKGHYPMNGGQVLNI
jgi:hypothetical protein